MINSAYVLGVDVSKSTLELCLIKRDDERVLTRRTIPNIDSDINAYLTELSPKYTSSLAVALEPTGPYWYPLASAARSLGYKVLSAPPKATKSFLASITERAKNDRLDANGIARYACHMQLREYTPKSLEISRLTELLAIRKKLSLTISEYTQARQSLPETAEIMQKTLDFLKEQLKELDSKIKDSLKAFDASERLQTVPGFGPIVTGALVAKLTQFDFKSSDSFVAYVGLDTRVRESGVHKGKRTLSHKGDSELRRLLYLAAQASIRVKDSPFSKIYQNHRDRGLSGTASLCVVARKLARTAWSIEKFNTSYDPDRVSKDLKASQQN